MEEGKVKRRRRREERGEEKVSKMAPKSIGLNEVSKNVFSFKPISSTTKPTHSTFIHTSTSAGSKITHPVVVVPTTSSLFQKLQFNSSNHSAATTKMDPAALQNLTPEQ